MFDFSMPLWTIIAIYSLVSAGLLISKKVAASNKVGYSVLGNVVITVGAGHNLLGFNPVIGLIFIAVGFYLNYAEKNNLEKS
ncbi:hypothetical protein [Thalassomonas sp. M1454]|uniref:hypothetical protein n=1 Tax=Thalassomonas sp. M1454 TaxID=2594477 RepID=UPI001180DC0C|nr:hypothetical protein [Thalassomonas sp. M1454]TRX56794.1 hypothetical protein FNN08_04495 [Thalassomonas sp. M1454]